MAYIGSLKRLQNLQPMARRRLADIVSCKLHHAVLCAHLSFSGCLLMAYIGSLAPLSKSLIWV